MLNLDTHILIKPLEASVTPHERTVLTEDPEWSISAIVLWEITKLNQLGRLRYGLDHELSPQHWTTCIFGPSPARCA
jgi:PIN domain nuclease of toxin-antitoxin system